MLQKIKKIGIIVLIVAAVVGATLVALNYASRAVILNFLKENTGIHATLSGYRFNIFGKLTFQSLTLGDALEINDFVVKYNAPSLLFKRTISSISVGSLTLRPKELTFRKGEGPSHGLTEISIPISINEFKIGSGHIMIDSTNLYFDNLFLNGKKLGQAYSVKAYINDLAFQEENFCIYADVIIQRSRITIKAFELQNDKISASGVSGVIALQDSITINLESINYLDYSANDVSASYNLNSKAGNLACETLKLQEQILKSVSGSFTFDLPDAIIVKSASFIYRNNRIVGEGVYLLKEKKLSISNANLSLNESGFKGVAYASIVATPEKINGVVTIEQLTYMKSSPFKISADFAYSNSTLALTIHNMTSTYTNLQAKVIYRHKLYAVQLAGNLYPSDIMSDLNGNVEIDAKYEISDTKRNGYAVLKGIDLEGYGISCKHLYASAESRGENDVVHITIEEALLKGIKMDTLSAVAVIDTLNNIVFNLKGNSEKTKFEGNTALYVGEKETAFTASDVHIFFVRDTLETSGPIKITRNKTGISVVDSSVILINGAPLYFFGYVDGETQNINVMVKLASIPIREAFNISGILSGELYLNGTLDNPVCTFSMKGEKFKYGGSPEIQLEAQARVNQNGIILDSATVSGQNTNIILSGFVPSKFSIEPMEFTLRKDDEYTLRAHVYDIPPELITELSKNQLLLNKIDLKGDVVVHGKIDEKPFLNGYLRVYDLSGLYVPIQLEISKADILAELTGDQFDIKKGVISTTQGTISVSGYGKNIFDVSREINLLIRASNASLYPAYNIFISGDGNINFNAKENELFVRGDVTVKEATIFQSLRATPASSSSPPPRNLNIILNITSEGNAFLVNEIADIEIKGDLVFHMAEGKTFLDGSAEVVKGYFLYLDRVFNVESGVVNFTSTETLEPNLSIKASSKVDTFNITMNLSGTFNNPQISLYSEPPLDELNILYLLTFGRVYYNGVSMQASELQDIKNRAFSLASTVISQNLRRAVGLQEFRLESNGGSMENPSLLIGLYLTPSLYFWYSHDIFDITKDMFQIRYKLEKNFGVFVERNKSQMFQIGIEYLYEF